MIAVHSLRKEFDPGMKNSILARLKKNKVHENKKVAVRNMSIKIDPGEVFGLLGHNGAGKTTTMKMIIQEESATAGRVKIGDQIVTSNQSAVFQQLGYCPQFDAVWQKVTVK